MSLGINNCNFINYSNTEQVGRKNAFKSNQNVINIKEVPVIIPCQPINNESGKALFSVGNADGTGMSVYKSENFDKNNPVYLVKYWDSKGNERNIEVEINKINSSDASYIQMFAYSVYCQNEKGVKNAAANFIIAVRGVGDRTTYDDKCLFEKKNFKKILFEFTKRQYNNSNFEGYWNYKKLYDYMN